MLPAFEVIVPLRAPQRAFAGILIYTLVEIIRRHARALSISSRMAGNTYAVHRSPLIILAS